MSEIVKDEKGQEFFPTLLKPAAHLLSAQRRRIKLHRSPQDVHGL